MPYRLIVYLSTGHFFSDISQGALPSLLPFFIAEYNLSYTAAAGIILAANITSSLVQPVVGHIADKQQRVLLAPLGILLAGVGLACSGISANFELIMIAVAISGLGTSAFHPDGARLVNKLTSSNKAWGMSMFAVGGNAGFALGPIAATSLVLAFGLKGIALFALPALLVSTFIYWRFNTIHLTDMHISETDTKTKPGNWWAFLCLSGIVVSRSVIFFALNTFVPLYWINVLHQSNIAGSTALTILFSLGVITTLIGGRIAEKLGYRTTIMAGFILLIPLLLLLTHINNVLWATLSLLPISLGLFGIYGPIVASGQNYLPGRVGLASGITIGLAGTSGGLAAPIFGLIADTQGLQSALQYLVFLPVFALVLSCFLPQDQKQS